MTQGIRTPDERDDHIRALSERLAEAERLLRRAEDVLADAALDEPRAIILEEALRRFNDPAGRDSGAPQSGDVPPKTPGRDEGGTAAANPGGVHDETCRNIKGYHEHALTSPEAQKAMDGWIEDERRRRRRSAEREEC